MTWTDLPTEVADRAVYDRTIEHLRKRRVVLPTFAQLADPSTIPSPIAARLAGVGSDDPAPENLFRVHWHNGGSSKMARSTPQYLDLPPALTGVEARILVALGRFFPMIGAHKVLPAYGCLVPRLVTGQFDPAHHRAVWPSTGNYCRGGVAISRILGCRGVAVLPEGMSEERFDWLSRWTSGPDDIVRTPGTESNVKEIYDRCAELARVPENVILNQFSEFGNYLSHYACTGPALWRVFEAAATGETPLKLAAFVAASGSAGTLAAGDYLKAEFGAKIAVAEAVECPTLLYNGYGEHNIQGIGDKHVPFIHNVMNTDIIVGISDRSTDALNLLFNSDTGRRHLVSRRRVAADLVAQLDGLGLSGIANVLAAIKTAKRLRLGTGDAIVTVATDAANMYVSERRKHESRHHPDGFDGVSAGEVCSRHLDGIGDDNLIEMTAVDRARAFNLGYYTWVEQQGVPLDEFERRRDQAFWHALPKALPVWDSMIEEFNARAGVN